jgi:hypothetical protein
MKEYRLTSTQMVHAPGIVRWAIHGYQTGDEKDKLAMVKVLASWKSVPTGLIFDLLEGKTTFTVEDDTVIIQAAEEFDEPTKQE